MATHSSIPAWRIPRTEEPGGLVLHVIVRSMIYLKLSFVKALKSMSRFFFFPHIDIGLFQHPLSYSFSTELPLWPSQRSTDYICVGFFLSPLFCFIDLSLIIHVYSSSNTTWSLLL